MNCLLQYFLADTFANFSYSNNGKDPISFTAYFVVSTKQLRYKLKNFQMWEHDETERKFSSISEVGKKGL